MSLDMVFNCKDADVGQAISVCQQGADGEDRAGIDGLVVALRELWERTEGDSSELVVEAQADRIFLYAPAYDTEGNEFDKLLPELSMCGMTIEDDRVLDDGVWRAVHRNGRVYSRWWSTGEIPDVLRESTSNAEIAWEQAVTATSGDVLEKLATSMYEGVRMAVARNSHVSADTVLRLADDGDAEVRAAVAESSHVSVEVLAQLASDPHAQVRAAVAENSNTSAEVLLRLASDSSRLVREAVLDNSATSPEIAAAAALHQ